jgi:hypothetical protein
MVFVLSSVTIFRGSQFASNRVKPDKANIEPPAHTINLYLPFISVPITGVVFTLEEIPAGTSC